MNLQTFTIFPLRFLNQYIRASRVVELSDSAYIQLYETKAFSIHVIYPFPIACHLELSPKCICTLIMVYGFQCQEKNVSSLQSHDIHVFFSWHTAVAISNFLLFYCSGVPKNKSCQQAFNENYHLPTATTVCNMYNNIIPKILM